MQEKRTNTLINILKLLDMKSVKELIQLTGNQTAWGKGQNSNDKKRVAIVGKECSLILCCRTYLRIEHSHEMITNLSTKSLCAQRNLTAEGSDL